MGILFVNLLTVLVSFCLQSFILLFFFISICKATPRIPKQREYENELQLRKKTMKDVTRFPFITEDMNKGKSR